MKLIEKQADILRRELVIMSQLPENPIDLNFPVISPYIGNDVIKLIVIGQDPTIRNVKSRKNISFTLNLDKSNSLKTWFNR